jgi:hypothetical protein
MMADSVKRSMAQQEFQLTSQVDPDALQKYQRAVSGKISPLLGLTEDPATEEIKDQIEEWKEGPPEDWAPVQAPIDPVTGQPAIDPATGAPAPPPPDPANPFKRLPHHLEQDVARKRHDELKRAMATADFAKHPPEWQQLFVGEYEAMRQAAGVATVAEQQQAQAQQAQAQQQAEAAKTPPPPDPAQEQAARQAEMEAQAQQKQVEMEQSAAQAEAERQHKAQQAEAERQLKYQMHQDQLAVKARELDAPVEQAQAQAKEITGGILPVVQEAVAGAIEQAVQHLTLLQVQSLEEQKQIVAEAIAQTQGLEHEVASQGRTLRLLAQHVQQPIVVPMPAEKEPTQTTVTVKMPEPKKRTVRLKKNEDGSISGEVTEEGGGSKSIKLHKEDGGLVGEVVTDSPPEPKKIRRKGK